MRLHTIALLIVVLAALFARGSDAVPRIQLDPPRIILADFPQPTVNGRFVLTFTVDYNRNLHNLEFFNALNPLSTPMEATLPIPAVTGDGIVPDTAWTRVDDSSTFVFKSGFEILLHGSMVYITLRLPYIGSIKLEAFDDDVPVLAWSDWYSFFHPTALPVPNGLWPDVVLESPGVFRASVPLTQYRGGCFSFTVSDGTAPLVSVVTPDVFQGTVEVSTFDETVLLCPLAQSLPITQIVQFHISFTASPNRPGLILLTPLVKEHHQPITYLSGSITSLYPLLDESSINSLDQQPTINLAQIAPYTKTEDPNMLEKNCFRWNIGLGSGQQTGAFAIQPLLASLPFEVFFLRATAFISGQDALSFMLTRDQADDGWFRFITTEMQSYADINLVYSLLLDGCISPFHAHRIAEINVLGTFTWSAYPDSPFPTVFAFNKPDETGPPFHMTVSRPTPVSSMSFVLPSPTSLSPSTVTSTRKGVSTHPSLGSVQKVDLKFTFPGYNRDFIFTYKTPNAPITVYMTDWKVSCRPPGNDQASPFGPRSRGYDINTSETITLEETTSTVSTDVQLQCFDLEIEAVANIPVNSVLSDGLSFLATYSMQSFLYGTNPARRVVMDEIKAQPFTVPLADPFGTMAVQSFHPLATKTVFHFAEATSPPSSLVFVLPYSTTGEFVFDFVGEHVHVYAYYLPTASTKPVLLGSVLNQQPKNLVVKVTALIPNSMQAQKVFLQVIAFTSTASATWTSSSFSVVPACLSPPQVGGFSETDLTKWAPTCANSGQCLFDSTCLCQNGWSGVNCDVKPCAHCSNVGTCLTSPSYDNMPDAKPKGECKCATSWAGPLCTQPETCADLSSSVCRNAGQLTELEVGAKACDATKPCQCVNNWSGSICDKCDLSCANGGRKTSTTCGCSCPTGFVGDRCECRGVDISLSLRGYNAHLYNYNAALAATPPIAITPELAQDYNIVKHIVLNVLATELNAALPSLSNFKLTSTDTPSKLSTFSFRVYYGCSAFNSALTKAQLALQHSALLKAFPQNDQIKALFIFDKDADDDDATGTITDTPETEGFPALDDNNEEEEPNSTNLPQLLPLSLFTFLLSLFAYLL